MITPAKHFAAFAAAVALVAAPVASAKTTIRVQSVIPTKADEVTMLRDYADNVRALTQGEVDIEVLPAGAVVGVKETLDAVDKGLIEGGFAWTHYWSGKHPAATLFGSPTAGAGLGMDNIAWVSWYMFGGGKELYDRLWDEMGVNVKGLMLQPVGPEALGWFKEPINSLDDFRKYRYRAPPGIPGETYNEIGVAAVAMGGGDILPALEKGTIDAAEWCCPKPDSVFGFQKVLKHYYLQGLHQVVVNADMYINRDVWNSISPEHQKAMEVAADASLMRAMAYRIYENGKALKDLTDNHGVIFARHAGRLFSGLYERGQHHDEKIQRGKPVLFGGLEFDARFRRCRGAVLGRRAGDQRQFGQGLRRPTQEVISAPLAR